MYFVPLGLLISTEPEALAAVGLTADQLDRLNVPWTVHNLAAVSLGNIVGGGVMVGLAHWFIHLRGRPESGGSPYPCLGKLPANLMEQCVERVYSLLYFRIWRIT